MPPRLAPLAIRLALVLGAVAAAGCQEPSPEAVGVRRAAATAAAGDLVYAASNQIRALDAASGRELAAIKFGRLVRDMRFSPDGRHAYVATSDGTWVVDAIHHKPLRKLGEGPVGAVLMPTLRPTELALLAARRAPIIARYDRLGLSKRGELSLSEPVHAVAASPDGEALYAYQGKRGVLAALGKDGGARWQASLRSLPLQGELTPYLGVSPDGKRLYLPVSGTNAGLVTVDATTGHARLTHLNLAASLRHVIPLGDGRRLVVNALSRVMLYDLHQGRAELIDVGHAFQGLTVTPDGKKAYAAIPVYDDGGAVAVIDLERRVVEKKLLTPEISPFTVAVRAAGQRPLPAR